MVTAHDLPNELLHKIAAEHQLLGVSRRLHSISLPHQYRSVALSPESLPLFARSVIQQPLLGTFVQDLTVEYSDEHEDDKMREEGSNGEDNGKVNINTGIGDSADDDEDDDVQNSGMHPATAVRAAEAIDPVLAKTIKQHSNAQSALVVLLLWHLPNLRNLQMTVDHPSDSFFKACYAAFPGSGTLCKLAPGLAAVQVVSLSWYDTEGGLDMVDLLPVFFRPSLARLDVFSVDAEGWDEETLPILRKHWGRCSLPVLEFNHAAVSVDVLRDVIRLMQAATLKSFTYTIGGATVGIEYFNGRGFVDALEPVHGTLEHLEVTGAYELWGGEDDAMIPSLRAFTALKELVIDLDLLGEFNDQRTLSSVLPTNLHALRLYGVDCSSEDGPKALLTPVATRISTLKSLGLLRRSPDMAFPAWLVHCCEAAKVHLHS